ncbi:hypothetical protein SAMD00023353_0203280 [Rosellinia necatrix]|uniref:GRF-like zinc ribbon domain-containing protein n=1 Tax=Rosellinia necatrix TaxID=77044 RepID=A0A1S8A4Z0_ROSNE|nr:hypothetical protein SAMD00023353_0203280 [Rosellinia necatrix]
MSVSFDSSGVRSERTLAPPPEEPPSCYRCGGVSELSVTRSSNRNGNAGRPFYKCRSCGKFLVFNDNRGNDPTNPECNCGSSSKRQVSGRSKTVAGRLHYVCRLGTCDFFSPCRDENGVDSVVNMDFVEKLSQLSFI